MTTQELTGYVRAIVDHKRIYDYVDEQKDMKLFVLQCGNYWCITMDHICEIKLLALHDPDGRGVIAYDPFPVRSEDYFYWLPTEGISKLHKEVEEMIDRINKIEL